MKTFRLIAPVCILLATACRTFPHYTDASLQYDPLVYKSDWRFIVVPPEIEKGLHPRPKFDFPPHPVYERLFRQARILPILKERLLTDRSPLTTADFILECDSLISALSQIDPVEGYQTLSGVRQAIRIYEIRDRYIEELKQLKKEWESEDPAT